ncbi:hypothetical protein ACFL47_00280 [Candidatus Latescibacterota bacterium]
MDARIAALIQEKIDQLTEIRHDIHQNPEIKFTEERIAGVVESFLDEIAVPHRRCAGTGGVATIGGGGGRVVALRSELDALPMPDNSGLPYASGLNELFLIPGSSTAGRRGGI